MFVAGMTDIVSFKHCEKQRLLSIILLSDFFNFQIWKYKEGITTHIGLGHAGVITTVRFSPDYSTIVSASADGAIFIWQCPVREEPPPTPKSKESIVSRSTCSLRGERMKKEENIVSISPTQSVRAESEPKDSKPASACPTGRPRTWCSITQVYKI